MGRRTNDIAGELKQYDEPDWEPLLKLVGEIGASDFMWMHEEALEDGRSVHAYKHIDTRRYLHLDDRGNAFVYTDAGKYRPFPVAELLELVLPHRAAPSRFYDD